jgi:arginase
VTKLGHDDVVTEAPHIEPISLLGIPLDANSSFLPGCVLGPDAIRSSLHSTSGNDANEASVHVTPLLDDVGDVVLTNERGSHPDADAITAAVHEQLAAGRQLISLGGDPLSHASPFARALEFDPSTLSGPIYFSLDLDGLPDS